MKRKLYSVVAAVSVGALLVAGTFAWTNFNSSIINNFFGLGAGPGTQERTPGGTLHNDFQEGRDYRDVYVENWGTEPLIVRIQLSEYMEIGEGAGSEENNQAVSIVDGASLDDVSTWTRFNGDLESGINRSADGFRYHWNWTMGGYKRYFPAPEDLRGTQDANGVEFVSTRSPVGLFQYTPVPGEPSTSRITLRSEVISMDEWISRGMPLGNYWVVDTDGFSYWASPLAPGEATGLLLHKVELVNIPEYDYFYAINVAAHMATVDDEPDNYQRLLVDATPEATTLVNGIANRIRNQAERELFEIIHTTDIMHSDMLSPILFQSASELHEFYHVNNNWFLQSQTATGDDVFDEFLLGLSDDYFSDRAIIVVSQTGSSNSQFNVNNVRLYEDALEVHVGVFHPWNSLPDFVNRLFVVSIDRSLIRETIHEVRISGTSGPEHFQPIDDWSIMSSDVRDVLDEIAPVIFQSASEMQDFYNENQDLFRGTEGSGFLLNLNEAYFNNRAVLLVSDIFCGSRRVDVGDVYLSEGVLEVDINAVGIIGPTVVRRHFFAISIDRSLISDNIRVNSILIDLH